VRPGRGASFGIGGFSRACALPPAADPRDRRLGRRYVIHACFIALARLIDISAGCPPAAVRGGGRTG
jgi:hypothetical protein